MATLARWQRTIVDDAGNVLPGASVEVRLESTGALAPLFSDRAGTLGIGNPIAADGSGFAAFHVAGGAYQIVATSGAFTQTWRYVAMGTVAEYDVEQLPATVQPQGRLTLTAGVSIMTTDVASASVVRYTPAVGRFCPIWNVARGAFLSIDMGGELSQAMSDATKSPAAAVANKNYDMLTWLDGVTPRCTRSAAWAGGDPNTQRGTGAGTPEREFLNGLWVNKFDVTNGPPARTGTVVGTIRTNGDSPPGVDMKFGTLGAGGGMATLGVSNAFNQVLMRCFVRDSTPSWTYSSATPRKANNSDTNRIQFVSWAPDNVISVISRQYASIVGGVSPLAQAAGGWGLDTTAAYQRLDTIIPPGAMFTVFNASGLILPQEGFHFISLMESSDGSNNVTYIANNEQLQGIEAVFSA